MIGEKTNCMAAHSATNTPLIQPARSCEPANSSMSGGSTGMTMPIATMSSAAATRMNAIAALRREPVIANMAAFLWGARLYRSEDGNATPTQASGAWLLTVCRQWHTLREGKANGRTDRGSSPQLPRRPGRDRRAPAGTCALPDRHADRQSRRHHPARPADDRGGRRARLRGHARDANAAC